MKTKADRLYSLTGSVLKLISNRWLASTALAVSLVHPGGSTPVGQWDFDNPSDLTAATIGNDLALTGSHTAVVGYTAYDGAARIDLGSFYTCTHGISPNGGGSYVNEFTLVFDISYPQSSAAQWKCFYQTDQSNGNDGDCFIHPDNSVGVSATGYSDHEDGTPYFGAELETWYRLVIVVDNGTLYDIYANGTKVLDGNVQDVDGRFSLDPTVLFFADENGEDYPVDVSLVAIYDYPLAGSEAAALKGPGGQAPPPMTLPFLQNVATDNITIMWECAEARTCHVEYGPDINYGSTEGCTSVTSGGTTIVYKSLLAGLDSGTAYHYRVIAGDYTSTDRELATSPSGKVDFSFGVWSDSQGSNNGTYPEDPYEPTKSMMAHMAASGVDIAIAAGDMAEDGAIYSDVRAYFLNRVHKYLGQMVPFFVAWGNHDLPADCVMRDFADPGSGNYSFDYSGCHFVCIDAAYWDDYAWIENDLQQAVANNSRRIFLFCHYPPYCELWIDGTPDYRQNLVPLLEQYDVDICFSGHTHEYERGYLNGVFYCITGGGSWLDSDEPLIYDWPHMTVGGYHDLGPGIDGGLVNEYVRVDVTDSGFTATMIAFNPDGTEMPGIADVFSKRPIELTGEENGGLLSLEWTVLEGAVAYWIFGASNDASFEPGFAPGYEYRIDVVPPTTTTWSSSNGIGDCNDNWTYLIIAVDSLGSEISRSNRFGEYDFSVSWGQTELSH